MSCMVLSAPIRVRYADVLTSVAGEEREKKCRKKYANGLKPAPQTKIRGYALLHVTE